MGCTTDDKSNDIKTDMSWWINKRTGLIQLNPLIPLDTLYSKSHGSGAVGKIWKEHHRKFSEFIFKYRPSKGVVEIGGGHGHLASNYQVIDQINWYIVEPNPEEKIIKNTKFIKAFFNDEIKLFNEVDTVVHSHVFEHIYYHNHFINQISKFLKKGQKHIFSVPNMKEMLLRKYNNCLNFEHTVFLIEDYIEYILAKNGFQMINKEYFKDDHSIFYCYEYSGIEKDFKLDKNLYNRNLEIYKNYIDYHLKLINDLNSKIDNNSENLFLFGAHVFSQYLIAFGLNENKIKSILDNDSNKQNKRLYGTSLKVNSPKILKKFNQPKVILKAGVYNDEIKADILNNINSNTTFLE